MKQLFALMLLAPLVVCGSGCASPTKATPTPQVYSGPVSGQMVVTLTIVPTTSPVNTCEFLRVFSGTLSLTLTPESDGTVTGTATTTGTQTETAITQSRLCTSTFGTVAFSWNRPVTGTSANLAFSGQTVVSRTPAGTGTVTNTISLAGTLSGGAVSGTLTVGEAQSLLFPDPQVASVTGGGSNSFAVTLR
jgi:hypothetical protein